MAYRVRFKRWEQQHVFLAMQIPKDLGWPFTLVFNKDHAAAFTHLHHAQGAINQIEKLSVPKSAFEFNMSTLFMIRLYGKDAEDQCEGLLVDMDTDIKAQILDEQMEVIKTVRLLNPIWEKQFV